eukprot:gene9169-biopygen4249
MDGALEYGWCLGVWMVPWAIAFGAGYNVPDHDKFSPVSSTTEVVSVVRPGYAETRDREMRRIARDRVESQWIA